MMKTLVIASALLAAASAAAAQGPSPITGAPFSAQEERTSTQTLSDGSHIARNTNASIARDSEGRTYRRQTVEHAGPASTGASRTVVYLRDPIAHTSHVISVESKTAVLSRMPQRTGDRPGGGVITTRPHRNDETVESLGGQMLEGVWAEGTRVTHTIPAGAIGNDRDLNTVSESWYSKDLQTVVMSKHSDPRMGESTFRMTNIQLAEPDATLFQVPAGFTVTEQMRGRH